MIDVKIVVAAATDQEVVFDLEVILESGATAMVGEVRVPLQ